MDGATGAAEKAEPRNILDEKIAGLWDEIVQKTNRVLYYVEFYGFGLMHIPDPSVAQVVQALDAAIAGLEKAMNGPELNPAQTLKIGRARQAMIHLSGIAVALANQNEVDFDAAIEALRQDAMF